MAIQNARMQQKRGEEFNFDPDKMLPGEWAVSLDTKYVRMCFSPGVCVRMATYEAFEADMSKIQAILSEVQTIEEAVIRINEEVSANADAVVEYTEQAKQYRDEAKQFRDEAETSATNAKTSEDKAKASETNAKISEENARRVSESLPEDYTELSKSFYNTAIKQKAVGDNIHVTDSAEARNVEFGLYGKAEQNGEPTPDNKVDIVISGASGSVGVVSCGKNLYHEVTNNKSYSYSGIILEKDNDNGHLTISGTSTASVNMVMNTFTLPAGTYCFSKGNVTGASVNLYNKTTSAFIVRGSGSFTLDKNSELDVRVQVVSGSTASGTFWIQIEKGTVATEYEPYTETVSTIPTPDGLAGIKVSSGGNYTDENGQQWICDEIVKYVDGSMKKIQRIGKAVFDGSDDEGWVSEGTNTTDKYRKRTSFLSGLIKPPSANTVVFNGMANLFKVVPSGGSGSTYQCDTGISCGISTNVQVYSDGYNTSDVSLWKSYLAENPMILYYELATPIITDLYAEEIAEIEKLHTFYPITNISNDADCGMSITYLADSKLYIDNQLAIQKAQQEEALATMLLLMPEEVQASMIENDTNNLLNESEV